jgi:hypothetical protein
MSVDAQFSYMRLKLAADTHTYEMVSRNLKECQQQIELITNPRNHRFAKELMKYIEHRRFQVNFFADDNYEIRSRATFIKDVISALASRHAATKLEILLAEPNIIGFKGFFSRNLYSLLTSYRDAKEVELEELPALVRPRV